MIASLKNSSLSGGGVIDNGTLTIDSANNRIGINTSSVTDTLTVNGTVEVNSIDGASSFDYSSLGVFTVRTTTEDDPLTIIRYSTSGGGTINLRRSNTDTLGSLSAVVSGGMLGTLSFGGYNSSTYDDGAQIRGYASENWTASAQGSNLRFYTNPVGGSSVVERMRIDSEGLITAGSGSGTSLGAWTSYTPTITAGTGTFTTVSASGKYCQIGKIVVCKFTITITTNGTAAGGILATLPVTAASGLISTGSGRENSVVGKMLQVYNSSTTQATIFNYDNTYPGGNGYSIICSLVYEAA